MVLWLAASFKISSQSKSFEFKVLEGIVKDSGVIDSEEAEG